MSAALDRLRPIFEDLGTVAVAVSGGVDSVTLTSAALRALGPGAVIAVHAVSPAVPCAATDRVRAQAASEGWMLRIIEAGEFEDPRYRANPVNRCFFCKTSLYDAIAKVTKRPIVSGANLDDLGEYRPGLDAARSYGVRHPYVEAGFEKAAVRRLARDLGLVDVAELPAAPCLSSRIETGLRVEPETLRFVHAVEELVAGCVSPKAAPQAIRCRVRASGIVIELDPSTLAGLRDADRDNLRREILSAAPAALTHHAVAFAPYRTGSAFLRDQHDAAR